MLRAIALAVFVVVALAPAASADVWVSPTNLTIQVRDAAVVGQLAGRPECRPDQRIDLYAGGVWVMSDQTATDGGYLFSPAPAGELQARFPGSQSGMHPNRHVCQPADSRVITAGAPSVATIAAEVPDPPQRPAPSGPLLVPGALGALAGVLVLGLIFLAERKRRKGRGSC